MQTITLTLDELVKEKNKHLEAIKHIDYMIERFFGEEKSQSCENAVSTSHSNTVAETSRMQQALDVCEQYLEPGNTVRTMKHFLDLIARKGIVLSRGGLSQAFKKTNSNIYFDANAKMWKLINQG